ncbi:MAG TPA: tyrosine-type recombinase/integrase [Blastocatellia bacterium]|nr:tyrosine-type recombinase/integrase [Blastocatellia bacterium]
MPDDNILTALEAVTPAAPRFDPRLAAPFYERSVSQETRRAYRRVVRDFFRFLEHLHPSLVTPAHILRWRDHLTGKKKSAATIAFKLSVVRSLFDYLQAGGLVSHNPAATKLVPPPAVPDDLRGRALTPKEVRYLLAGPDRSKPEGARDYALLLLMLKTSLRVSEACSLRLSNIRWSHGRWVLRVKVKGGRERSLPLAADVKQAIDDYLRLDRRRRSLLGGEGQDPFIFQPHTNYRTLVFDKPLSPTMAWHIVRRWAAFAGLGKVSPHDLRRTAITRALDLGLSYRQVQMMSGHKDPKTVMRYDHGRENLEQNAANFLTYGEG